MADKAALETEKAELVKEMAALQKKLVAMEDFTPEKYYSSTVQGNLKDYREQISSKAKRVANIAFQLMKEAQGVAA